MSLDFNKRMNQHPIVHYARWMVCAYRTFYSLYSCPTNNGLFQLVLVKCVLYQVITIAYITIGSIGTTIYD
jgi:hypothetical protein